MKRLRRDFSGPDSTDSNDPGYDLKYDWDLIVASFAAQYGIRLDIEDLHYGEFRKLCAGLMPDTPLGKIISIRKETRRDVTKHYGSHEKQIRAEWKRFVAKRVSEEAASKSIEELQASLAKMFG